IDGAAKPKRLIFSDTAAGQPDRVRRQRKRVVVPLENRKFFRQRTQYGVLLRLRRQRNAAPAELGSAADLVEAAESARDQLTTQADAKHGLVAGREVADQV